MPTPTKSTSTLRPSSSTTSSRPTAKFQCWFLTPDLYRREKKTLGCKALTRLLIHMTMQS
jgi:hypothetical protein